MNEGSIVTNLEDLSDDEFTDALKCVFNDAGEWRPFLDRAVVERTVQALQELRVEWQETHDALHESLHSLPPNSGWRAGEIRRDIARSHAHEKVIKLRKSQAVTALRALNRERNEQQQAHAAAMRQGRGAAHLAGEERNAKLARDAVRRLALAIRRHRSRVIAGELEPEPQDLELWSILDRVQLPLGDEVATLTEILNRGSWIDKPLGRPESIRGGRTLSPP